MLRRAGGDPGVATPLGLTPLSYACAFRLSIDKRGGDAWEARQVQLARIACCTHSFGAGCMPIG